MVVHHGPAQSPVSRMLQTGAPGGCSRIEITALSNHGMDMKDFGARQHKPSPFPAVGYRELAVPGIPISTEGKVSDVAVTDCKPIIMASAWEGSIPNTNGNRRERPAVPPRPGRMPTTKPRETPPAK